MDILVFDKITFFNSMEETMEGIKGRKRIKTPTWQTMTGRKIKDINHSDSKNQLSLMNLTMLGIGGAVGSGIFVASGLAINQAGPGIIVSFVVGGVIAGLIMFMVAEMSVSQPTSGSFSVYSEEYLGRAFGFISGWLYWMSGILTLATEMVAAALITRFWLPSWPIWLISLIIAAVILGISLLDVRAFARIEEVLSFIKAGILLVVIVMGIMLFAGVWPGVKSPGATNFINHGGLFPNSWKGVMSSLLLVLYTYAGEQVIGPATGETQNPSKTVPKAVTIINAVLVILYLGSIITLVGIIPWNQVSQNGSGFVPLFAKLGLPGMTGFVNAIILSAVLSAMNSNMYGVPRMLKSLAERHDAPVFLGKNDKRGVPIPAVLLSSACLLAVVGISYILPKKIFVYIASASGVTLLVNWLIIAVTHLRFRHKSKENPNKDQLRYPGFPYTTITAIMLLLVALSTSALSPNQLIGLITGLIIISLFALSYFLLIKKRHRPRTD
jgi:L-asparagine transporter-like permease